MATILERYTVANGQRTFLTLIAPHYEKTQTVQEASRLILDSKILLLKREVESLGANSVSTRGQRWPRR